MWPRLPTRFQVFSILICTKHNRPTFSVRGICNSVCVAPIGAAWHVFQRRVSRSRLDATLELLTCSKLISNAPRYRAPFQSEGSMVTVKTKDWGLQFKHLKAHIGNVAAAVKQHEADLKDELSKVAAGGGQHAYARHGWQTGWQAQMVRAVAGKTPDQAFDPYGCNPEIRTWGRVMIADPAGLVIGHYGLGADGRRVVAPVQPTFTPLPDTAAPPKGASAGHFISPIAQQLAMTSSKTKLKAWGVWTRAQRKKGASTA